MILRRGPKTNFLGPAFQAAESKDGLRLAEGLGQKVARVEEPLGGVGVRLTDPSGMPLRVVADVPELPRLEPQPVQVFNFGRARNRINATQRPLREPTRVLRLGHVVLMSNRYQQALQWYLDNLGLIVSDFLFYPGQRERGPVMSFIRCDRAGEPADHHSIAMTLGPSNKYVHSALAQHALDIWWTVKAYFTTVSVAAPLAALTGVRMSGVWPERDRAYPVERGARFTFR